MKQKLLFIVAPLGTLCTLYKYYAKRGIFIPFMPSEYPINEKCYICSFIVYLFIFPCNG